MSTVAESKIFLTGTGCCAINKRDRAKELIDDSIGSFFIIGKGFGTMEKEKKTAEEERECPTAAEVLVKCL